MIRKLLLTLSVSAVFAAVGHAQTILTQFTFETSAPTTAGPFAAETGTGSALGVHAGAATYSSPAGNGSTHSFSSNTWAVGDYYQFSLATGASGIYVQFSAVSSTTGPGSFALIYSTNGGTNFTLTTTNPYAVTATPSFGTTTQQVADIKSFDLSGVAALMNANVIFRLVDTSTTTPGGATVATTGTSRVDDFTVSTGGFTMAMAPEPSSYATAACGIALLCVTLRLRRGAA